MLLLFSCNNQRTLSPTEVAENKNLKDSNSVHVDSVVVIASRGNSEIDRAKDIYSNGSKFRVVKYVYKDLDDNILGVKDVKKTTFTIDADNKLFKMEMDTVYYEYYYYNKVDRIALENITNDAYGIYKTYSTDKKDSLLTDVLLLGVDPVTNELLNYQLYFANKGFITFSLTPIK